jgi:hypothetical protein
VLSKVERQTPQQCLFLNKRQQYTINNVFKRLTNASLNERREANSTFLGRQQRAASSGAARRRPGALVRALRAAAKARAQLPLHRYQLAQSSMLAWFNAREQRCDTFLHATRWWHDTWGRPRTARVCTSVTHSMCKGAAPRVRQPRSKPITHKEGSQVCSARVTCRVKNRCAKADGETCDASR